MPRLNLYIGSYHWPYNELLHLGMLLHSLVEFFIFPPFPVLAVAVLTKFHELPVASLYLLTVHDRVFSPKWNVLYWWPFFQEDFSCLDLVPFGLFFHRQGLTSNVVHIGVFFA